MTDTKAGIAGNVTATEKQHALDCLQLAAVFKNWLNAGKQPTFSGGDMRHIIQTFENSAALASQPAEPVQEPVAEVVWYDPRLILFPMEPRKIIDASLAFMDSAPLGTKLYAHHAPSQEPVAVVKALELDGVYVIPREMTDEEWSEVKYNVDRKADPDIPLWRIQEAVKYAHFIAGHRGDQMISSALVNAQAGKVEE